MLCKIRQSLNTLKNLVKSHKKYLAIFAFLMFFGFGFMAGIKPALSQAGANQSTVPTQSSAAQTTADAKAAADTQAAADAQAKKTAAESQTKTQAKDTGAGSAPSGVTDFWSITGWVSGLLLTVAAFFLKLAIYALSLVIEVAGYNGYLDSAAVNIGWVMVRDITNMFFVVILLLVAFGTILGLEQYEWKKMLVKFFFAAILVNFSRTICGLIIDVSQVVAITFVNGIAATAGGNLINSLNLQGLFKMAQGAADDPQSVVNNKEIFASAVGALVFSAITLGMMLVFVFMLLARMIMLWVLIVLSPFAFVLSVIPQTEKYASQWWSEFGNHVLVGPVTVFFLWLAFAIVGGGTASDDLAKGSNVPSPTNVNTQITNTEGFNYNSITNFAIAIGVLLVGAKVSQSLGSVGGSAMSKATDFGKKVAMVGSGVAAGMWLAKTGRDVGAKAAKGSVKLAYEASPVSDWVERASNYGQTQLASWKAYRAEGQSIQTRDEIDPVTGEMRKVPITKKIKVMEKDEHGVEREVEKDTGIPLLAEDKRSWFQKQRYNSRMKLIQSRKALEKTEKSANVRDEALDKSVTAIPKGWFMKAMPDGFDRIEEGMVAAMKERSAAKTKEFSEYGRQLVLGNKRFKDGKQDESKGTVGEQIAEHEARAARGQSQVQQLMADYKKKYLFGDEIAHPGVAGKGADVLQATIAAKLETANLEKAITVNEGEMKTAYLRDNERGKEMLRQQTKLAEKEKEEHAVLGAIEKKAQAEFVTTGDGSHILEATKAAELKAAESEAMIKREESKAEKEVKTSQEGKESLQAQKEFEVEAGALAAEIKEAETDAEKQAKQAKMTELQRQKAAEMRTGTLAAEVTEKETEAEKLAKFTPEGKIALQAQKAAEVRSGAKSAQIKAAEEDAATKAKEQEAAALRQQKTAELKSGLAAATGKKLETAAEEAAKTARPDLLQKQKQEEVITGAMAAEIKEKEAIAEREAKKAEHVELQRQKAAEVRAGAVTAETKTTETKAETAAKEQEKLALRKQKEQEVITGRYGAEGKELETEAERDAKKRQAGQLTKQKESEIRAAAVAAETKTTEAKADTKAKGREQLTIQAQKEEEVKAGAITAEGKAIEAQAETYAKQAQEVELQAQKEAEIRAGASAAEAKQVEERAGAAAKEFEGKPGGALERQKLAELAAKASGGVATQAEAEANQRVNGTPQGKALISQINVTAQGKKAADDFIKGLEEKDLQEHFEKAAKRMNDILAMGDTDIDAMRAEEAAAGQSNPFIKALTEAARLKETTDESGMRRRMAADAATNIAVAKPLYGTTTPSTAYTDYMESKMKEFKSLDRSAAAQKANQIQAELSWQKKRAEASAKRGLNKGDAGYQPPLTIGQNAQLLAANTFLQSEAWNDDQHGNSLTMFKKLKNGDLSGHEKEIWESQLKDVEKLGWLKPGSSTTAKADGTYDFEVDATYSRQQAADSQALALTGNDVDLRAAHNAIAKEKERRERQKVSALATGEEAKLTELEESVSGQALLSSNKSSIDQAVANAKHAAQDLGLDAASGDGLALVKAAEQEAKRSVLKADEGIALALKTHLETVANGYKTGYGEVAQELFATKDESLFDTAGQAKFEGIASVDELKARYALHQDALQDGTKSNKKFAMENGHGELGYNTDNDEDWKMYRFTTNTEGESSIASERAKQKTKTLIDSDQKHATGKLDQATGIMDYLMTTVMSKSFGSAEKALDLKDMPARQVAAAFMRLSEEDAILRTDDRTGNKVGVLAGGVAAQTHLASLGKPPEKIRDHLLAASVTSKLLAGPLGYALLASKNYGHTNEMQARRGVINEDIGGVVAETVQQLATQILSAYEKDKANFFVGTEHQGNEKEVVRRLRQIQVTKFEIKDDAGSQQQRRPGGSTTSPEPEVITASAILNDDERGQE